MLADVGERRRGAAEPRATPCAATISLETPEKSYRLNDEIATLVVRPRGWHLDGAARARSTASRSRPRCSTSGSRSSTTRASCSSAAAGRTSTCRSSRATTRRGSGRGRSRSPRRRSASRAGSIRCTVLIETILAAFEMEEILYELRDYGCALNAGRWDYIFSAIKKFGAPVLPDRAQVTMTVPFMRAYTELLVAHVPPARRARDRRHGGVHPVAPRPGGERGRAREGARGQGARVGRRLRRHVGRASRISCRSRPRSSTPCSASGRTRSSGCATTSSPDAAALARLRRPRRRDHRRRACATNVSVGVRYLDAWLHGVGAAAIDNLMEDVATAEISRSQVWSWVRAGRFDEARVRRELGRGRGGRRGEGALRRGRARAASCVEFLTLPAYTHLE